MTDLSATLKARRKEVWRGRSLRLRPDIKPATPKGSPIEARYVFITSLQDARFAAAMAGRTYVGQ